MIRKITILIFITIGLYSNGQNFNANLITGISTSQVSSDNLGGFNKFGIKLGASVNHKINDATRSEYSMYYIDKGSNDNENFFQIDLSYIESSWCIQKSAKGFIYEGGITFGVLIEGATYDKNGRLDKTNSDFNKFDVGAVVGAGIKLKERIYLFWEIGNTIPLFPIQKHTDGITYRLNKGKYNAVFSFSLRYLLNNE